MDTTAGWSVISDAVGTDTLQFGNSSDLAGIEFTVLKVQEWAMNAIGLGPSSVLLNDLVKRSIILSKSWSAFWGLEGTEKENQMDGSLILGGYDRAKTRGAGTRYTVSNISPACDTGLIVDVSTISMHWPNGTSVSVCKQASSSASKSKTNSGIIQ